MQKFELKSKGYQSNGARGKQPSAGRPRGSADKKAQVAAAILAKDRKKAEQRRRPIAGGGREHPRTHEGGVAGTDRTRRPDRRDAERRRFGRPVGHGGRRHRRRQENRFFNGIDVKRPLRIATADVALQLAESYRSRRQRR